MIRPHATSSRVRAAACLFAGLALASGLTACRGERAEKPPRQFFPGMDDQPKWDPQGGTDFYADGRAMRPPPAGTVAFGVWDNVSEEPWAEPREAKRAEMLAEDPAYYRGQNPGGGYVDVLPVPITRELLERGQERYTIFCALCHGMGGDGLGTVGSRWMYPVPSYHDATFSDPDDRRSKAGRIFEVVRWGVADETTGDLKMPAYGHALDTADAWAVVAYVRTLQRARTGTMADVPAPEREMLSRTAPPADAQDSSGVARVGGDQ